MSASRIDGRLYDRLFDACTTDNQLSRVQILLENRMTPAEAFAVAQHVQDHYSEGPVRRRVTWLRIEAHRRRHRDLVVGAPAATPRYLRALHAVQWAQGVHRHLVLSGRPPSSIRRSWVRGGGTLFGTSDDGPRTLVVGFTGNLRGFMLPTHLFLQFVGTGSVDVLKLEVPRGRGYVEGVVPFSHDFPSTLDWLRTRIDAGGYDHVACVGTSGGGLPALLAAARLGADTAFAAGPAARMNAEEMSAQLGATDVLEVLRDTDGRTRVTIAYGDQSARDTESVDYLATALPQARIVTVPDAGHACLFELVERGQFAEVVDSAILGQPALG